MASQTPKLKSVDHFFGQIWLLRDVWRFATAYKDTFVESAVDIIVYSKIINH